MEPTNSPHCIEASARTTDSISPDAPRYKGCLAVSGLLQQTTEGTRRFFRPDDERISTHPQPKPESVNPLLRHVDIFFVPFDAYPMTMQLFSDGTGRTCTKERIEYYVTWLELLKITRYSRASGFWVECAFRPSSLMRSSPVQSGSTQSLRICKSSLRAFIS